MTDNNLQTIKRKQANSGKTSYADPIVIHKTSRSKQVVIPFYIPHSDHTELAIKIQTYKYQKPPLDWILDKDTKISLKESASRNLLAALKTHLAIAEEDEDGEYILVKVNDGTAKLGDHDPDKIVSALIGVLSQDDIVEHLKNTELTDEFVNAFQGAIRLKEMQSAVAVLKHHLEQDENKESIYQKWCEKYPWIFGNAYVMNPEDVRNIAPHDHLDILLSDVIAGFRDIVELKRPDMSVLQYDSGHKNYYFSADVSKTIGQCHRYLDVFSEVAIRGLRDHPDVVAYHPKATIVIGRSHDWSEEKNRALHGLNCRLSGINIMTYDHLLSQGERLIHMLSPENMKTNERDHDEGFEDIDPDFF